MTAKVTSVDLSIVMPAYNESRKIAADILQAFAFFRRHGYRGEVILVDDGSSDGTAEQAARCRPPEGIGLEVLREEHRGKGHAVRCGMIRSRGRHILFIDSGGCIPYDEILRGLRRIEKGECDIAHASRRLPESIIVRPQTPPRRLSAWLFRHVFVRLLGLPSNLTDSQAGLKIYRGEVGRILYRACRTDGFLFDAEIILRAVHAGYSLCEFPVTWTSDPDSRLQLRRMPFVLMREAWALKKRLRREWCGGDREA